MEARGVINIQKFITVPGMMVLAFNLSLRRQEKGISECEAFLIIIVSSKLAGIT